MVVHDQVIDYGEFKRNHPGGGDILDDFLAKDATEEYEDIGHSTHANNLLSELVVGTVAAAEQGAEKVSPQAAANAGAGAGVEPENSNSNLSSYLVVGSIALLALGLIVAKLR